MTPSKMKVLPKALLAALIVTPMAFAQQTPTPTPQKVEKIEVTGSNIKRVDAEGSAPIQVITREEIERSGKQTVTEMLRTLPTNAGGGLNDITGSNSFSSGASTVSLRGLGSSATLVLLNGRRIAPFGNSDPNFGQSAVVNLDSLPLDVVDRIEILKDGASAIYGSEAVAGVVNIILRKDFTGAQIGGSYSINRDSEYKVWRANTTLGYGDLARDKYNVFINYERLERETTKVLDVINYVLDPRLQASPSFLTFARFSSSFANNYLTGAYDVRTGLATAQAFAPTASQPANCVPGAIKDAAGRCRWDLPSNQDIVPKSDRDNFFARGTIDFSANLSGFAEGGFNRTKTFYRGNPTNFGDIGSWYSSTLQKLVNLQEFLPVGNRNNPFSTPIILRHRFTEVGEGNRQIVSEAKRFVGGLKGTNGPLDWETGYLYTENTGTATQSNQLRASVLRAAVLNNTYDFLNPSLGSTTPDQLRINTQDKSKSSFSIFDAKGSMELVQLAGGPMAVAAGFEYRKEDRTATPDAAKLAGEVVGFGAAFSDGKRNVTSAYAELSVPFAKNIETQLAFRTDRYSDYGNSTTPKIGIKWKVLPTIALRASYAEGFRAPSLTETSKSSVTAFTTVTDPRRCIDGTELACNSGIAVLLVNAARLDPEKSKSYNLGFVWDPVKDVSVTLDYFDIRRKNEIQLLDFDLILANEGVTSGIYANRVIRGPVAPGDTVGPLQAISSFYFNSSGTTVTGYDLDVRWNINLGEMGKLTNRAAATYYKSFKTQDDASSPFVEFASYGFPRARGTFSTFWEYRDFTTGVTANYNKGYRTLRDPRLTCSNAIKAIQPDCEVNSNTTADLSFQYSGIKNLTLNLIVRNIFDQNPPLDPNARPLAFTYHPFQSVYYTVGGTYRFK